MSYDPEMRKGHNLFNRKVEYRICVQCIMDTSDPEITFDEEGICSHCHERDRRLSVEVYKGDVGRQKLGAIVAQIKAEGRKKDYDCIIGLSGGVDSTYVAYLVKKLGLRPLAVHLDNGWNSEIAVRNIENIVKTLDIDLHTHVLDWQEFRNLQLAFLRASTPDSEIPSDHAIVSTLYQTAMKHRIRWLIEGSNVVTEVMVPATWSHGHSDFRYIKTLNDLYSPTALDTYPHYTYWDYAFRYPRKMIYRFPILNYIDFDKPEAMKVMKEELGWQKYGGKHYESIYTRFYQGYMLPEKFGFDKRRSHISCLVRAGNLTRAEALEEVAQPAIPPELLREDRAFVIKKLGITEEDFEGIMKAERKTFWDYPSYERDLPGTFRYSLAWRLNDMRSTGVIGKAKHSVDLARWTVTEGVVRAKRVLHRGDLGAARMKGEDTSVPTLTETGQAVSRHAGEQLGRLGRAVRRRIRQ